MDFKECIDSGIIKKEEPDLERANNLIKMAEVRKEFWCRQINEKFTSLKIEGYYEIMKKLILAHMYKEGYNCSNHLCLITYLKEKFEDFDYETEKIDEIRSVRNQINYKGFFVDKDYLARNEIEFINIIDKLKRRFIYQEKIS